MPYTPTSLLLLWLSLAVLVGLSATGSVTGIGLVFLVALALAGPALLLRRSS